MTTDEALDRVNLIWEAPIAAVASRGAVWDVVVAGRRHVLDAHGHPVCHGECEDMEAAHTWGAADAVVAPPHASSEAWP